MSKIVVKSQELPTISCNGYLRKSNFRWQIHDVWGSVYSTVRIFFVKPTNAEIEVLNQLCCWGGPDKTHPTDLDEDGFPISSWELPVDALSALLLILPRDKSSALKKSMALNFVSMAL